MILSLSFLIYKVKLMKVVVTTIQTSQNTRFSLQGLLRRSNQMQIYVRCCKMLHNMGCYWQEESGKKYIVLHKALFLSSVN